MTTVSLIIMCTVIIVLFFVVLAISYVKAPPSQAFVISGLNKEPRVLIGKGGFRIPFLERLDRIYLGQITVDIKTETSVPTNDFINVDVDAVAKIRVEPTPEGIRLAGKNFLNMAPNIIASQLQDSLQGNMREIIGTLDLKTLNVDRDSFSDQIMEKASPDMKKLGIEILSCNIQNVTDREGLIKDLGADNTSKIKKDAAITKARADKEVSIEVSKAKKEANDARVESETAIAVKNNELEIKKSELKVKEEQKKAEADMSYKIQEQELNKTLNVKTVDAKIEQTKREQTLSEEKIKIRENELRASVNKQADADKYKLETNAAAELEQRKRVAEAETYEAEQQAKAMKAKADANKYSMLQEAEGIKAKGEAEAYAIEKKGIAEAEAMDKKAEAYQKYNGAAIVEMMVKILPQIAESVAKPLGAIDSVNIYGTSGDSGISGMSGNIPVMMKQVFDTMTEATGVDMREILKSGTIEAKTTRNINLNEKAADIKDNIID